MYELCFPAIDSTALLVILLAIVYTKTYGFIPLQGHSCQSSSNKSLTINIKSKHKLFDMCVSTVYYISFSPQSSQSVATDYHL